MIKYQLNVRLTVYQKIVGKKIWLGQKKFELKKNWEKTADLGPLNEIVCQKKKIESAETELKTNNIWEIWCNYEA